MLLRGHRTASKSGPSSRGLGRGVLMDLGQRVLLLKYRGVNSPHHLWMLRQYLTGFGARVVYRIRGVVAGRQLCEASVQLFVGLFVEAVLQV